MPYLVSSLLLYSNSQIQGNDPTDVLNSILPFKLCVGGCGFEIKLTHAFCSAVSVSMHTLLLISSGEVYFIQNQNIWNYFPFYYLQLACYSIICEQTWGNIQSIAGYLCISNQWRIKILGVRTEYFPALEGVWNAWFKMNCHGRKRLNRNKKDLLANRVKLTPVNVKCYQCVFKQGNIYITS